VVYLRFDLKYFIAATLLSLTLLLVDYRIWIVYGGVLPTQFLTYLFPLARLVIAVFLPFAVMYLISTRIQSWTHVWPILVSTFLGCILGGIINVAIDFIPALWLGVNYGYSWSPCDHLRNNHLNLVSHLLRSPFHQHRSNSFCLLSHTSRQNHPPAVQSASK